MADYGSSIWFMYMAVPALCYSLVKSTTFVFQESIKEIPVPDEPDDQSECKLWIGNLDSKLTELALVKILQKFGKLKKFDFLYHKSGPELGKPRGYCFVTYENRQDAERAMQKMNRKLALSKRLVVKWARKETEETSKEGSTPSHPFIPSTESKIQAIEAKLNLMKNTEVPFTLEHKQVLPPGSSHLSAVNIETRKKAEMSAKPYQKKPARR